MAWRLPPEITLQILKLCTIRGFLSLTRADLGIARIGSQHHSEIIHSILSTRLGNQVLPVAQWCSRARHAARLARQQCRNVRRQPGRLGHAFVQAWLSYLRELPRTRPWDGKPDGPTVSAYDALWIESLHMSIRPFCTRHLSKQVNHFAGESDYPPTRAEVDRVERAGFYVAAMIEACHVGPPYSSHFATTWKAIPQALSLPELYQVRQFIEWMQDELGRHLQPLQQPHHPPACPLTYMRFGSEFCFAKAFGMRAALDVRGNPATDPRYRACFSRGALDVPPDMRDLYRGTLNFGPWESATLPTTEKPPFIYHPGYDDSIELLRWFDEDPHSNTIFNYFCPGICRVPGAEEATGGPCRLALWDADRVDEATMYRVDQPFREDPDRRYTEGLVDWIHKARGAGRRQDAMEKAAQAFLVEYAEILPLAE